VPQVLIKAGHWKRARALVEPKYMAQPNDSELNYLMSEIDDAFDDLENARARAEKAVALRSEVSRYHQQLAEVYGETAETASLFAKGGWARRFKAEAERAVELDPNNLQARFDLLEYDLQAPRLMGGGKDKAGVMAEEIARIDPVQGCVAQARLAQDRKDLAAEESWYLKAVAARPGEYEILMDLGNFYNLFPQPKLDKAVNYAEQALKIDPSRVDAYALLAAIYASEARWFDLESTLARAEKSVPDDLNPYFRAGQAILAAPTESGLSRAEGYFRKYLTADPEGDKPTLAHAHWQLGLVMEKEGRKTEAVSELKTALRLKPSLEGAKKALKRLE
jgi:tetratricopeptide (TPR) repeat protein